MGVGPQRGFRGRGGGGAGGRGWGGLEVGVVGAALHWLAAGVSNRVPLV